MEILKFKDIDQFAYSALVYLTEHPKAIVKLFEVMYEAQKERNDSLLVDRAERSLAGEKLYMVFRDTIKKRLKADKFNNSERNLLFDAMATLNYRSNGFQDGWISRQFKEFSKDIEKAEERNKNRFSV